MLPAGNLCLVVGYDGSAPARRALDAAVSLLQGRVGRIEVVYVAHVPDAGMVSAAALGEIEINFDEVEQELRTEAGERLRGRAESWGFARRQGMIADQLIAVAKDIRDAHDGEWSGALPMPCTGWSVRSPSAWHAAHRCPW